jgi:O-antigen ligase
MNDMVSLMLRFEEGVAGRNIFWNLSANIIRDNIWLGLGPGAYKYEMFNYMPVILDSWHGSVLMKIHSITDGSNASHNFFLFFFSDMGIFGLFSAVLLRPFLLNWNSC